MKIPAKTCQYSVPCTCADGGIKQEFPVSHACQSCWDTYQMADAWYQSARERSHYAVVIKVAFTLLNLLLI